MIRWTPERAGQIEDKLTKLIRSVPGTREVSGCSNRAYEDYKVYFEFQPDPRQEPQQGMLVFFHPERQRLEAVSGGLGDRFPQIVTTRITEQFPGAKFSKMDRGTVAPLYIWEGISETDLRSIKKRLILYPLTNKVRELTGKVKTRILGDSYQYLQD